MHVNRIHVPRYCAYEELRAAGDSEIPGPYRHFKIRCGPRAARACMQWSYSDGRMTVMLSLVYAVAALVAASSRPPPFSMQVVSSMEKIYPSDHAATPAVGAANETASGDAPTGNVVLSLARGEYEAAQLVVVPTLEDLTGFAVHPTGPLCTVTGSCLAADAVAVHPVGWVNQLAAKVDGDRVGWIPDPLLQNRPLHLTVGKRMSFLIRVYATLDAIPGNYEGTLTVSWGGDMMLVAIAATVWDFELPRRGHLSTCLMTTWSDPQNMWPDRSWDDHEAVTAALLKVGEVAARNRMYPCTLASGLLSWNWKGQGATHMGWPTHDCKPDNSGCLFNATRTGFLLDWLLERGENPLDACTILSARVDSNN
eukprot:COSAG02_NODE_1_length_108762_cov_456.708287_59_plen_367_part_00